MFERGYIQTVTLCTLLLSLFFTGCTSGKLDELADKLGVKESTIPLSVNPSTVDFGTIAIGAESTPTTITLTSNSNYEITITSVSLEDSNFSLTENNCPISPKQLTTKTSCNLLVKFNPISSGTLNSTLKVKYTTHFEATESTVFTTLSGVARSETTFAGISAAETTTTTATLHWTKVDGIVRYQIFALDNVGTLTYLTDLAPTIDGYVVTGLSPSTNYTFRVNAIDNKGFGDGNANDKTVTTKDIGSFAALTSMSVNEGSTQTKALNCSDSYGSNKVFSLSQSNGTANCTLVGASVSCSPAYNSGHSNFDTTVTVECAINDSTLTRSFVVSTLDVNRTPALNSISNQSITTGNAITTVTPVESNTGTTSDIDGDSLLYSCTFSGGGNAAGTACSSLPNTSLSFNTSTGALAWTLNYASAVANNSTIYTISIVASDQQSAALTATRSFTVTAVPRAAPTVTSVSPTAGSISGGTSLTITGTGFFAGASIDIGGVSCGSLVVGSATSITCTTGARAAATVSIVATNADGQSGTGTNLYTYRPAPTVTSVSPTGGNPSGGTSITLTGTGFVTGATVTVGGVSCASVNVASATSLSCTTGAHAAGTTSIIVTNTDSQSGTGSNLYTYQAAPTFTQIAPAFGTYIGGTSITITGTGFLAGVGVTLGGASCGSLVRNSSTSLTCTTPAATAGVVNIAVTNSDTQSVTATNAFTYTKLGVESWVPTSQAGVTGLKKSVGLWTGNKFLVFGGENAIGDSNNGFTYDPISDSWNTISTTGAITVRAEHTGVWTGSYAIYFGGYHGGFLNTGGKYDPVANAWTAITTLNAPSPRRFHLSEWLGSKMIVLGGQNNTGGIYTPYDDTWTATETTGAPTIFSASGWTGNKILTYTGSNQFHAYVPATNTWTTLTTLNAPNCGSDCYGIWTGKYFFVKGSNMGIYNSELDTWSAVATTNAPTDTYGFASFWTGSRILIWGGNFGPSNTGALYNPTSNTWQTMTTVNTPRTVYYRNYAWTGSQLIAWGGGPNGSGVYNTGGIYTPPADPATDSWTSVTTTGAPLASQYTSAPIWTGNRMLVWGGKDIGNTYHNEGAQYNPVTDSWTAMETTSAPQARYNHTQVWTGKHFVVFGGADGGGHLNTGGRYDPIANSWSSTTTTAAPSARSLSLSEWSGSKVILYGGTDGTDLNTGGQYDPQADDWTVTTTVNAPSTRNTMTGVWTGTKLFAWGSGGGTAYNTGGLYDPFANSWSTVTTTNAPSIRANDSKVWTGSEVIVWGGWNNPVYLNTGGKYNPATNSWTSVTTTGAPDARNSHSATWTGGEMIIFGGDAGSYINTGGKYQPGLDLWTTTTTTSAPSARINIRGMWTGSKIIIFGGNGPGTYLNNGGAYTP